MEHLSNDHENHSYQHKNSHKLCDKTWEFERSQWKLRQQDEFPNGGKAIVKQILASEKRNKSKRAGLQELQSGI